MCRRTVKNRLTSRQNVYPAGEAQHENYGCSVALLQKICYNDVKSKNPNKAVVVLVNLKKFLNKNRSAKKNALICGEGKLLSAVNAGTSKDKGALSDIEKQSKLLCKH